MTDPRRHPHLTLLLTGYFHQDWPLDHPDADDVVTTFLDELDADQRVQFNEELSELGAASLSEDALAALLLAVGCGYHPPGDGRTRVEWISGLTAAAAAAVERDRG